MNWDELYASGIEIETITKDSDEYQAMFSAAVSGNPSAEYCLGQWTAKFNNKSDVSFKWLQRAAKKGFKKAIKALQKYGSEAVQVVNDLDEELLVAQAEGVDGLTNNQSTSLVIKEHDFREAMASLKKYTEQAKKNVELSRVPYDGGLFNLGSHKVTGTELNNITSQIQGYLISLNTLGQGLVDEFGQVYKAFEHLDKDYISGIVTSIKAAEEVSKQEQKDRRDIKELVEQHELAVAVLKQFKKDIEKLKHLTDVDKAWELIEEQAKISKEISGFIGLLKKMEHIKDVDALWRACESTQKELLTLKESIERQAKALSAFADVIHRSQEAQKQFEERVNHENQRFHEEVRNKIKALSDDQAARLKEVAEDNKNAIADIESVQKERLKAVEEKHEKTLTAISAEQLSAIRRIENEQREKLKQMAEGQNSMLERIADQQSSQLAGMEKSLEEEKSSLNAQVDSLARKVKTAYIVAGGAVVFTLLQLFLNVLGVM